MNNINEYMDKKYIVAQLTDLLNLVIAQKEQEENKTLDIEEVAA